MAKTFSASDYTQKKVLKCFDLFIETCVIKDNCLITNGDDGTFCKDNINKCITELQKAKKFSEFVKSKDAKDFHHILAHIDWLYTVTDTKTGKKEDVYGNIYSTDKFVNLNPFFNEGVCSFGTSVSSGKNSAVLFILDVIAQVKGMDDINNKKTDEVKKNIITIVNDLYTYLDKTKYKNDPKQGRNVLLYLCDPIINKNDNIIGTYYPIVSSDDEVIQNALIIDSKNTSGLKEIADKILNKIKDDNIKGSIDWKTPFYSSNIMPFWKKDSNTDFNESTSLRFKKAIILYGPPGTSKTYQAKQLAKEFIRGRDYKFEDYINNITQCEENISKRIHRVQLHPNYTYEDFVWGYQIEEGKSIPKKGYLLRLIDEIAKDTDEKGEKTEKVILAKDKKTHFLILDEINRVDLSRLFGEVFSALECPREEVALQQEVETIKTIKIPDNLYIIGTMNEIDFSLERVDFALRRRFIWFFYGYKKNILSSIIFDRIIDKSISEIDYNYIIKYVASCTNLNKAIDKTDGLGPQFEIGHTVFAEIVNIRNEAQGMQWETCKKNLWNFSIKPMIEAYLGNADKEEKKKLISEKRGSQGSLYCAFFIDNVSTEDEEEDGEE